MACFQMTIKRLVPARRLSEFSPGLALRYEVAFSLRLVSGRRLCRRSREKCRGSMLGTEC